MANVSVVGITFARSATANLVTTVVETEVPINPGIANTAGAIPMSVQMRLTDIPIVPQSNIAMPIINVTGTLPMPKRCRTRMDQFWCES